MIENFFVKSCQMFKLEQLKNEQKNSICYLDKPYWLQITGISKNYL